MSSIILAIQDGGIWMATDYHLFRICFGYHG